jgi:hypothetical protein
MSYGMTGKIKVPYHTLDHTSGLETVCSLQGFHGEPYFSPLIFLFSKSTPKTIKCFLRSPKLK